MDKNLFNDLMESISSVCFEMTEDQKIKLIHMAITGEWAPTYSEHDRIREFLRNHESLSL
jgi:hypothetical protein